MTCVLGVLDLASTCGVQVKDKRMPMMNEIVDVLESVAEDVDEWVVPKAPELKPEEETAIKDMAEKVPPLVCACFLEL